MIHWFIAAKNIIPAGVYPEVFSIDFAALRAHYDTVLFDLDNTLLPYDNDEVTQEHTQLFETLLTLDYKVMIVSNSGSDRVGGFAEAMRVPYVKSAKKPLKSGFHKALGMIKAEPSQTLFVGDQLMTDVWGSHRAGLTPLLVKAIKRKSERWYTKLNRRIEKKMLRKLSLTHPDVVREIEQL